MTSLITALSVSRRLSDGRRRGLLGRAFGIRRAEVAAQEVELVGDRPLAPLAHVDVEVGTGVLAHLDAALGRQAAARAAAGGATASRSAIWTRIGQRSFVHLRDRAIRPLGEDGAGGDLVAPGRAGDRLHARLGVLGASSRRSRPGGATVRDHQRRLAAAAPHRVLDAAPGQPQLLAQPGVAGDLPQRREAVEVRRSAQITAAIARVGGGDVDDVAAGPGGAPEDDPVRVDAVEGARELDRGAIVLAVARRPGELARLAASSRRSPGSRRAARRGRPRRRPRRRGAGPSPWCRRCHGPSPRRGARARRRRRRPRRSDARRRRSRRRSGRRRHRLRHQTGCSSASPRSTLALTASAVSTRPASFGAIPLRGPLPARRDLAVPEVVLVRVPLDLHRVPGAIGEVAV